MQVRVPLSPPRTSRHAGNVGLINSRLISPLFYSVTTCPRFPQLPTCRLRCLLSINIIRHLGKEHSTWETFLSCISKVYNETAPYGEWYQYIAVYRTSNERASTLFKISLFLQASTVTFLVLLTD